MSYTKTQWVNNTTPINETNLNKIESGIENNDINIGEENYDNTKTYEVGDIVRYNEKIYKCITAITTAENFDISKWEQTNIVEIVQSEKSKIYELIEAISTPIVGEGENITLNDTAEKRFENFDIEGNSEQETREGYNKLPIKFANATNNGITLTVKDNGKLLLNGTSTSTALFNAVLDNEISLNNYIFKIKKNSGTISANSVQFFLYTTGYTSSQNISVTPILSSSKTTLSSNAYTIERIVIPAETTLTDVELEVMISETEKQYEPYGASPSPDYPSEIKTVGSNVNIFDKDNMTIGKIWSGATLLDSDVGNASPKIPVTAGKTYIRNAGYSSNYIIKEDNSVVDIQGGTNAITMPEDSKYWMFNISKDIDINTIKAEEGSISTPQSKYGQGCVNEVICNKNLFNKNDVTNGMYINRNTGFISTGTDATNYSTSGFCKVKSNTQYYLGISYSSSNYGVVYYDKNKEHLSGERLSNTFTTPDNCEYVRFTWITANYDLNTIQLVEGSTEKPYVEHQEQIYTIPTQQPFRAIGDTRDKFILKENGKWYERHYAQRLILNGTEGWNFDNNNNRFYFGKAGNKGSGYIMSSHYLTGDTTKQNNTCEIWTGAILFRDERYTNVNDWKSYLAEQYNAGTPVYVDYILKTPLDIECTSEQTEILNQIYIKAKSYKGVTHIYSNDAVSPNCYVEAVKDLTTLIQ